MARPLKLDDRRPKTLSLDSSVYKEFEKIVGPGYISEEIRAFMRERVEQEKNGGEINQNMSNKNLGIFQEFDTKDKRDEIRRYIDMETDMTKLNILQKNCSTIVGMVNTRKDQNYAKAQYDKRTYMQSNEEIEAQIKREKSSRPI